MQKKVSVWLVSCSIVAVNQYQFQILYNAYLSMFFVKVQFPLEIHQMMMVMMMMMIHHWIWIKHELDVDSSWEKWNFCVTFTTSVLEANFSFFLWSITETCVSYLMELKFKFMEVIKNSVNDFIERKRTILLANLSINGSHIKWIRTWNWK